MSQNDFNMILVHPGLTELNEQGRLIGNLDLPLSESGELQVRKLADDLGEQTISLIITAPDLAAQQTAQAISDDGSIKIRIEENFANLDIGLWHGKAIEELKETQPRLFKQWREHPENVTPPEGETIESADSRVRKAMKWISKKKRSGTIVIVASHPLAAIIQAQFLDIPLDKVWDTEFACGSWIQMDQTATALT